MEPTFHDFCQRYNPIGVGPKLNDFEPHDSNLCQGLGLIRACKTTAREATDTLYSRNCFWLYHDDNNKILDWLKWIGSDNRLCLRYLRIDYAYGGQEQEPMIPDLPTHEISRYWPDALEDDLDSRPSDVIYVSCEKSTLQAVHEVKSVIQPPGQNYQLSRLEIVLPYCYVYRVAEEDKDKDHIECCQMHSDGIPFVLFFCGFPELLEDLSGIKTLAIGPIHDLDDMESIARGIGVTNLMTFGRTDYVDLETERQIDQAKAKGWKIAVSSDESFRGLKVLGK